MNLSLRCHYEHESLYKTVDIIFTQYISFIHLFSFINHFLYEIEIKKNYSFFLFQILKIPFCFFPSLQNFTDLPQFSKNKAGLIILKSVGKYQSTALNCSLKNDIC